MNDWKITKTENNMKPSNYYQPTPVKWRKIGDAILAISLLLNGFFVGAPMSDEAKVWAVSISGLIGGIGKLVTNFFKEETTETNLNQ